MESNIALARPIYYREPPSTLVPTHPISGEPIVLRHHTGKGACGCGVSHAGTATAPAPTLAPPGATTQLGADWTPKLTASLVQTAPAPGGNMPFTMPDFSSFNLASDWWKLAAGALIYKLLAK